jgi:aminopeptidase N
MNSSGRPLRVGFGLLSTLLLAGTATGQGAMPFGGALDPESPSICGCGKSHALAARAAAGLPIHELSPGPGYSSREALTATDLISCDLDMEIIPATTTISGVCTMVVRSKQNGLNQFTIVLRTNYTVTGATINGSTPISVPGPVAGGYSRTITLDRVYNDGEQFTLRIPYSGVAASRGFGSIEFQTQPSSTNPIIASLSEAYFAATWWPCKDGEVFSAGDNSDKFTMRMAITAPDTLTSVANGPRESVVSLSGGRKKYTYSSSYPIATYLVAFASSVYNTWTTTYTYVPDEGGPARTMPLNFYIYPGSDTPANRAAWSYTSQMLDTFRPFFGLYPFINEQYGIYQFPFGGGMEHQTMTGQGTFNESVTAHELGHQWWGDNVTNKTWNHIWLNEGFATYSEAIWAQYKPGSTGEAALHAAMAARRPGNPGDSVYVVDITNMNRIFSGTYTYNKGAWVLHQLRHVIGDTAFFDGLKAYRATFQGSAATTEDFAASMTATTGTDLTNFIQQWVYGVGAPDYACGFQNVTLGGQNYLRVSLRQTQNAAWPGVGTPGNAFAMPVDLRIDSASGSITRTVNNTARSQHFLIPVPAAATGIAVDPLNWILSYNKVTEPYFTGPAKIVTTSPAPGTTLAEGSTLASASIAFSDNVTIPTGAITVTGPNASPVSFTQSYNATSFTSQLTFSPPLGEGTYTVRVPATITAASIALDGEITGGSLPSGNGLAGGDAIYTFTIPGAPCPADFNQDGGVDGSDIEAFFLVWQNGDTSADVNQDGGVDGSDIETFFMAWEAGGC